MVLAFRGHDHFNRWCVSLWPWPILLGANNLQLGFNSSPANAGEPLPIDLYLAGAAVSITAVQWTVYLCFPWRRFPLIIIGLFPLLWPSLTTIELIIPILFFLLFFPVLLPAQAGIHG